MTDAWVAVVGLRYPDGDAEYEKALEGERYKVRVVEPGQPAKNIPAKSVDAYLAQGREVIVTQAEWDKRQAVET